MPTFETVKLTEDCVMLPVDSAMIPAETVKLTSIPHKIKEDTAKLT